MGALQSSGGTITGTLRAFDSSNPTNPCVGLTQDLPATGTLSSNGDLVLTVPISGGTATITCATFGSTFQLQAFTQGTWQIVGGACAMPSTSTFLTLYPPITGTYVGTLTNPGNSSVSSTITAVLTQSVTPDSDGRFALTGTVASSDVCPGTRTLTPEVVSGNGITTAAGALPYPSVVLIGANSPVTNSIQGTLEIYDLNCSAGVLTGRLIRQ